MGKGKKKKMNCGIRLAENVALLAILDQVPAGAALNPTPTTSSDQDQRILSFEKENEICTALAFIAGVSDDYRRVMAVAVEEHRRSSRIHIKLAINKSKPENGEMTLKLVVEGFKRIFKVLSKVANGKVEVYTPVGIIYLSDETIGNLESSPVEVFREVLNLSRNRILQRLRSKKAKATRKGAGKPSLASLLRSLSDALDSSANDDFKTQFHQRSALLLEMLEALETTNSVPEEEIILQRLVEETGHFLKAIDLDQVPDQLERLDKTVDKSIGAFLKERLTRVSHYRTVAVFLFKEARAIEIFRDFRIETVCYTPTLLSTEEAKSRINFNTLLQEFSMDSSAKASLIGEIRDQCKKDQKFDPIQLFKATASNTLSSGKVHAEVQLLFHYDAKPVASRPRVIASTKSACFLCNTLFRIHDQFYIPRSHGKLYPGWLLPSDIGPTGNTLAGRLNSLIQELNKTTIQGLLSKTPRKRLYSGNESFVHELNVTISSLASSIVSALTIAANQTTGTSLPVLPKTISQETIRPATVNDGSLQIDCPVEAGGGDSDTDTPTDHTITASPHPQLSIFNHDTVSSVNLLGPEVLENNFAQDGLRKASVTSDLETAGSSRKETCRQSTNKTISHKSLIIEQAEPTSTRLVRGEKTFVTLRPDQASSHVFTDFINIFLEYPGKGSASSDDSDLPAVAEVEWLAGQQPAVVVGDKEHDVHCLSTQSEIICQAQGQIFLRSGDQIVRIGRKYDPSPIHV